MGTPATWPPSRPRGAKQVGPPADVYALGAILYECLTGRPPFQAATPMETLVPGARASRRCRRACCSPGVPRDLETICLKCLEKDPARRYASAADLADDLGRYLAGEPIHARPVHLVERVASVLQSSGHDVHFGAYGEMLFWLAGVILGGEAAITAVYLSGNDFWILNAVLRLAGPDGPHSVVVPAGRGLLPTTRAEKQLYSTWIGYVLGCAALGVATVLSAPDPEIPQVYQPYAVMAGVAFVGAGFDLPGHVVRLRGGVLRAGVVMATDLRWAMLEFGALWAVVLVLIGVRLRRLRNWQAVRDSGASSAPKRRRTGTTGIGSTRGWTSAIAARARAIAAPAPNT